MDTIVRCAEYVVDKVNIVYEKSKENFSMFLLVAMGLIIVIIIIISVK